MYLGRTTLSKFLIQQLTDIPGASDLGALLVDVAAAVKAISAMTAKGALAEIDRKSTRLNSSHLVISYAVFCLKKKTIIIASSVSSCCVIWIVDSSISGC